MKTRIAGEHRRIAVFGGVESTELRLVAPARFQAQVGGDPSLPGCVFDRARDSAAFFAVRSPIGLRLRPIEGGESP